MDELLAMALEEMEVHMGNTIDHLKSELLKIRAGKANISMVDGVRVDYYGTPTPLNQCSTVAVADARTITITPWERKMIPVIERAIIEANLGFNPQSDGEMVRIPIPKLTEERRIQLSKQANGAGEDARIALRNLRRSALSDITKLQKDGEVSEDQAKTAEKKVEETMKGFNDKVTEILKVKEEEIMTV
ncbi:MAG: ribosome recycling factor [Bacteroidia bacterium]